MNFEKTVEDIYSKDSRYKPDAYEFVAAALHFSQKKLKRQGHILGRELLEGLKEFAIEQFGPMAKAVLNHWGIHRTEDVGNIVFNLIEKKFFFRTETDSLDDFKNVYDFESAFSGILENMVKASPPSGEPAVKKEKKILQKPPIG